MVRSPSRPRPHRRTGGRWSIAGRNEALQIESEILPSNTGLECPCVECLGIAEKGKSEIEFVFIGTADIRFSEGAVVLELGIKLPMFIKMRVDVYLSTLEKIGIPRAASDPESRRRIDLVTFTKSKPERNVAVGVAGNQGEIFEIIQWLRFEVRVG